MIRINDAKYFVTRPQLCDCNEEANKQNNIPYIPFIEVKKNTFGENFHPPDLIATDLDKKMLLERRFVPLPK